MDTYFCEKQICLMLCFKHTHTQQQQTLNTYDEPQPPYMSNQKMWVLRSHFRWVRSIHHHYSGRKRGDGQLQWIAGRDWQGGQPGNQTGTGTGSKRSHSSSSGSFSFLPFSLLLLLLQDSSLHTWLGLESPIHHWSVGWVITGPGKATTDYQGCSNYRVTDTR